MNIADYLRALNSEQKKQFARRADTSVAYLFQLASGHRRAGIKSVHRIAQASNQEVTPADLRPDIYGAPPSEGEAA